MKLALYTDDNYLTYVLRFLFREIPCHVYSRDDLDSTLEIHCTHMILRVNSLDTEDWVRLQKAIDMGMQTYLLIGSPLSISEAYRAWNMGVKEILIDPVYSMVSNEQITPEKLIDHLIYSELQESIMRSNQLINIGSETYFHTKQYWVKHGNTKIDLTEKESALLLYFIEHEGEIITKHKLANQFWGGYIQVDGISKVISRLKKKLGPARDLISSRHLGGFIYLKNRIDI